MRPFSVATSSVRRLLRFSRCLMYSVALESTVALFSLCAGVRPSRSSGSSSSSVPFGRDMTRRLGTLSRNAAILSFRLVRYRFSIMLCAVFLGGCEPPFLLDDTSSKSSVSSVDFLFLELIAGSGEECDDDVPLLRELGL